MKYKITEVPIVEEKDERYQEYKDQLERDGVCPPEVWNLDRSMACFLVPRLKLFRDIASSHPEKFNSLQEWKDILAKMVDGFQLMVLDDYFENGKTNKRIEDGLDLFREYYFDLWD